MFGQVGTIVGREAGPMSTTTQRTQSTTVDVRATGHVRTELGTHELEFTFEGDTLRAFLEQFFAEYGCEDLVIADSPEEATANGWARYDGDPPGRWEANPEGERTRAYARVLVNGRPNELLDGFDTEIEDGDRVALVYPFFFCC